MSWNYRVIKRSKDDSGTPLEQPTFDIREVYYDKDGNKTSVTTEPCYPQSDSLLELRAELNLMFNALSNDVLNYEDF